MTANDWIQIVVYFVVLLALAVPLGHFMARVMSGEQTWLSRLGRPLERALYRFAGVAEDDEMTWTRYATALLVFSAACFAVVYLLQRLQGFLPANPAQFGAVSPALAFNTAVSFATNTNWQAYGGETTHELPHPGARPGSAELRFSGGWHRRGGGADARLCPRGEGNNRQFLGRPDPFHAIHTAPARAGVGPAARFAGRGADVAGLSGRRAGRAPPNLGHDRRHATDHRGRPSRQPDRHQAAGHQWWRLLQRQLRPSVREPDACLQLPGDARHPAHPGGALRDVRQDGEGPAAGLGAARRDDGHPRAARHRRRPQPSRAARRYWPRPAPTRRPRRCRPAATWRGRRPASASSTPPSGPRRQRRRPTAP